MPWLREIPWRSEPRLGFAFLLLSCLLLGSSCLSTRPSATVKVFGYNSYNALGELNMTELNISYGDLHVDLANLKQLACGVYITTALMNNNSMWSMGWTGYGQINFAASDPWANYSSFTLLQNLPARNWTDVISGDLFQMIWDDAGIPYWWGDNYNGVLTGSTVNALVTSVTAPSLPSDIVDIICSPLLCVATVYNDSSYTAMRLGYTWGGDDQGCSGFAPSTVLALTAYTDYIPVSHLSLGLGGTYVITHNGTLLSAGAVSTYFSTVVGRKLGAAGFYPVDGIPPGTVFTMVHSSPLGAIALTTDQDVYVIGLGTMTGNATYAGINQALNFSVKADLHTLPADDIIIDVRLVSYYSILLMASGNVYSFGSTAANTGDILQFNFLSGFYTENLFYQSPRSRTNNDAINACLLTVPLSTSCSGARPSSAFACLGTLWVTRPALHLPQVTISNFTATESFNASTIILSSPTSSLYVSGCLSAATSLQLAYTLPQGPQTLTLLSMNAACELPTIAIVYGGAQLYNFTISLVGNRVYCNISYLGCPLPAPDNSAFLCSANGQWITQGPITLPTLTLPEGQTVVAGDLSLNSLNFSQGLNSSLVASGCISINSSISITLTASELSALSTASLNSTLLQQNPSCAPVSTGAIDVSSLQPLAPCSKITTTTSSNAATLSVLFTLDSSPCAGPSKTWWIILAAVLGGVVLLAIIGISLLVTLNPKVRKFVRPHARKTMAESN